jgi:hypothetical protein
LAKNPQPNFTFLENAWGKNAQPFSTKPKNGLAKKFFGTKSNQKPL